MAEPSSTRWNKVWSALTPQADAGADYRKLVAAYAEPPRAYHNLHHIGQCLDEFEPARHLAQAANAVELAIWFHDAIYDSRAKDNEERSAAMASEVIRAAKLQEAFSVRVAALIIVTKHNVPPANPDAALIVDVDLSILGQTGERFDEYERQIREEYDWVTTEAFNMGRTAVLKSFLDRQTIYSTDFFRAKYEASARKNLERSIENLREK